MSENDQNTTDNQSAEARIQAAAERMEALKAWAEQQNLKMTDSADDAEPSTTARSSRA